MMHTGFEPPQSAFFAHGSPVLASTAPQTLFVHTSAPVHGAPLLQHGWPLAPQGVPQVPLTQVLPSVQVDPTQHGSPILPHACWHRLPMHTAPPVHALFMQ